MHGIVTLLFFPIICTGCPNLRRIIGGQDADEDEHPYVAKLDHEITNKGKTIPEVFYFQICTCVVITPIWTLTAAHCFGLKSIKTKGNMTRQPVIRYGAIGRPAWVTSEVRSVTLHPTFQRRISGLSNDIGLVKTSQISLARYARVSALDFLTIVGHEVILFGYGDTVSTEGFVDDVTSLGMTLQMIKVIVVPCNKEKIDMSPAVCVARRCGNSSAICPGDFGGPMLHPSGVVGVNSMGTRSLRKFCSLILNTPNHDVAVITPTSPYIDWIREKISSGLNVRGV